MTFKQRKKDSPYGEQPFASALATSYASTNLHEDFKLNGQCAVCRLKGHVYVLSPDTFIAKYYTLTAKKNEVCSECWVKAKVHDPKKDQFQIQFDYNTGLMSRNPNHLTRQDPPK